MVWHNGQVIAAGHYDNHGEWCKDMERRLTQLEQLLRDKGGL
jgi:hypothetical protein